MNEEYKPPQPLEAQNKQQDQFVGTPDTKAGGRQPQPPGTTGGVSQDAEQKLLTDKELAEAGSKALGVPAEALERWVDAETKPSVDETAQLVPHFLRMPGVNQDRLIDVLKSKGY